MTQKDSKTKNRLKAGAKERAPLKNEKEIQDLLSYLGKQPDPNVAIGRVEKSSDGKFTVGYKGKMYVVAAKGNLALANMISQAYKDTKLSPDLWPIIVFVLHPTENSGEALGIITTQEQLDSFKKIGLGVTSTYDENAYEFEEEVDIDNI